jgi:hypothetical protein
VYLLGGDVDLVTPRDVLRTIDAAAPRLGATLIANHNAHSGARRHAGQKLGPLTQAASARHTGAGG